MRRGNSYNTGSLAIEQSMAPDPRTPNSRDEVIEPETARDTLVLLPENDRGDGGASTSGRPGLYICLLTAFSGIAGFLFGYDTGNISGALPYIEGDLLVNYKSTPKRLHWIEGIIVSSAIFGAAVGSACGGVFSDRLGRKAALKFADIFFTMGAVTMAFTPNAFVLIVGRLLVGVGVGLASVTAPVYIAETAPSNIRATLVTVNTLMITTGQFSAYLLDYFFTFAPGTWRWMLGIAALPALLQILGLNFLPESPRWLVANGRHAEAHAALVRLRKTGKVEEEMQEVVEGAAALKSRKGFKALQAPEVRMELMLGVGLQILQQLCGINTVMYYTPMILSLGGITNTRMALLVAMGPAAVNATGTVLGMFFIDRSGRRKLLLASVIGVVLALLFLGGAFKLSEVHTPQVAKSTCPVPGITTCGECIHEGCGFCSLVDQPQSPSVCISTTQDCPIDPRSVLVDSGCPSPFLPLVIAGVVAYLAAFSPGLGSVPWSVNAEIFPNEVRGLANGAAATANWITNAVVSQLFLALADYIHGSGVFWLLAVVAALGGLWAHSHLPETKGLTLEEVQDLFVNRATPSVRGGPPPGQLDGC